MSQDLPSWARKGVRVVCIDASSMPGKSWVDNDAPVVGAIYTVTETGFDPIVGRPTVYLAEIRRGPHHLRQYGADFGYWVARFRPLHTLESDLVAHFTKLLHQPVSSKEPAL